MKYFKLIYKEREQIISNYIVGVYARNIYEFARYKFDYFGDVERITIEEQETPVELSALKFEFVKLSRVFEYSIDKAALYKYVERFDEYIMEKYGLTEFEINEFKREFAPIIFE